MKKLVILSALCLLAMAVVPVWAVPSDTVQLKNISVSVTMDRDRYEPGEPIQFNILVMNNSGKPVTYQFGNSPIYELWINTSSGSELWRYKGESGFSRQELRLQPGETKVYRAMWNQNSTNNKHVEPGWYEVFVRFSGMDQHSQNTQPLRAKFRIDERLANGPLILFVPLSTGALNPSDVGKQVSIEGILRMGPQGLYLDTSNVKVKR